MSPPLDPEQTKQREELASRLYNELRGFGLIPIEESIGREASISTLRRNRTGIVDDGVGMITLVDDDDVLTWEEGPVTRAGPPGMRRNRRGGGFTTGEPIAVVKYEKLGFSDVASKLAEYDLGFTPNAGLREYKNGQLTPCAGPASTGKILLLIHGTFSNNDSLISELKAAPNDAGGRLLADAERAYTQVLAFDHHTVSRSPLINALEIARILASTDASVDVICHSRGGLVTRWLLEVFDLKPNRDKRAVFVGSPLRGTSLAAPDRLRHGLDLMTNIGARLADAGSMVPYLSAAGALVRVLFSLGNFTTKLPLIDAGVAMIPGLAAQSRIENNFELKALEMRALKPPRYFAVQSNYEPPEVGLKFWKVFCGWKLRAANALVDRLVFSAENDLVVDTKSMTEYGFELPVPVENVCCFSETEHVHHTLYFRQLRTIDHIRRCFGIPAATAGS